MRHAVAQNSIVRDDTREVNQPELSRNSIQSLLDEYLVIVARKRNADSWRTHTCPFVAKVC